MNKRVLKAIIVEDEPRAKDLLIKMLTENCQEINVTGFASNTNEATKLIDKQKPDLVFLDLHLEHGELGFYILDKISFTDFQIIITTAYDEKEYLKRAFKFNTVDYLTKPFTVKELKDAVKRSRKELSHKLIDIYKDLRDIFDPTLDKENEFILLKLSNQRATRVKMNDIICVEADGSLTNFYLVDIKYKAVSLSLKEVLVELNKNSFFKVHKSFIVNFNFIKGYRNNPKMLYSKKIDFIDQITSYPFPHQEEGVPLSVRSSNKFKIAWESYLYNNP